VGDDAGALAESAPSVADLERGRLEYERRCAACHGRRAEGIIGPNLTDGASISRATAAADYRAVIADGVPSRGMPGWAQIFDAPTIDALTSYVWSLRNTNASGGKPPQGDFTLP
jgi:cytochrome c oxidase cbb3-type subunit 3